MHAALVVGLLLVTLAGHLVMSQNISDAKNLKTYLFDTNSYDPEIRPIDNQADAIGE